MANNLDPNVAQVSPALYSAAYYANLNPAQNNQVNQIAGTVSLNKRLSSMSTTAAQKEWTKLDPNAQEQIKAMYGDASYIPKQPENFAIKVGKAIGGTLLSPFKKAFEVAGDYNRAINTPYLVLRQISQGASPFDVNVYHKAWDGRAVFDNGSLNALHKEYGDTDTFVAMKTLQGLKPGEIIDAYGQVNTQIINSITKMFNEPTKFQNMLEQFKGAQVSYGRDLARVIFNANPIDHKLYGSSKWNKTSGAIDMVAQIVTDPLTWLTGGTSKAITRADKLAEALQAGTKSVDEVFARKDIRNTWDNVAGPLIKRLADARDAAGTAEGKAAAVAARNEIARVMPDLNNDNMLELLRQNKIFTADAAQKFFNKSEAMLDLLSGRVDGTTFFRTGIPIAKRSRNITSGLNRVIGDYFNGAIEKEALDGMTNFVDDVRKVGIMADSSQVLKSKALTDAEDGLNTMRRKIGRLAARFPGSAEINITDEGVAKTLPAVKSLARTIYPKAHAEFFSEAFLSSNPHDRVILLRGLYTQIMQNMGLHADAGGKDLMEKILQDKFADTTSFANAKNLDVPPQFAEAMKSRGLLEQQPVTNVGGLLTSSIQGPLYKYQGKPTIGNLPWSGKTDELSLSNYALHVGKGGAARDIIDGIGGVTRKNFIRKMVNGWSVATLFPRLGIRSALDEAFFYSMMAPGEDLVKFARGRKIAKGIAAYTGSDEGIPPIKRAILNALGKNPAKYVGEDVRYVKTTINGEERYRLNKQVNIANEAMKLIEKSIPEHLHDKIFQAMINHPEIVSAMVNSIIGKSGLEGGLAGGDLASMIISNSHYTNMMRELGLTPSGSFKEWDVAELAKINESAVSAAHFGNWFMRFTKSGGKFGSERVNPATIFMRHNALKSTKDFEMARDEFLSKIGINPENMSVTNEKSLKEYLDFSQQTSRNAMNGWTGVDTAVHRVEHMLLDMYATFHGSAVSWNDRLYGHIHEIAAQLRTTEKMGVEKSLGEALNSIDYNTFEEYTRGFRPEGKINTELDFAKADTNEAFFQKIVEWAERNGGHPMEWMDAQNNHLFRQPALWNTYAKLRERYDRLEKQFVQELIAEGTSHEMAVELAEKKFTETAMNHAANYVLKSSDNPQIRSNLAWTLRTTGRFYRATEDFYRRVFRLKDVTPQVLYRMRLAHLGLQSNGFIHPDENGDPYLVMPADNIIFHAINGSMSVFGANVKQPLFNDFAVKLALGNPSFQQDAGQPSLSGPFVAVPVLALQQVLAGWGGDLGKRLALDVDKLVLGNVNQNLTLRKALVPSTIDRVWSMLPKGEQDQQEASAAMQAIAYNAAHGLFLSPEKLAKMPAAEVAKAKKEYLDQIKVTAHNVVFMRAFLGMISPIAPSMQESKDVPAYLKNAGINGLRPEFADVLQAVMRNSKGQIQDPYEAALMAFTGKHPGKLVYTVARNDRQTNIMVQTTKNVQNWMMSNRGGIDTYGDAAFIFAPHIGDYDSNVYLWLQASGITKQRKVSDYLDEVAVAQDRQKYFDLTKQTEIALKNPMLDGSQRSEVISLLRSAQQAMKNANPLLEQALNSKSFGIGKQQAMLDNLKGILADQSFKMDPKVRAKMQTATTFVVNAIDAFKKMSEYNDIIDGGASKQDIKDRVDQALRELGGATDKNAPEDPVLNEAMRSIFSPLLNFYVRDTLKAGA